MGRIRGLLTAVSLVPLLFSSGITALYISPRGEVRVPTTNVMIVPQATESFVAVSDCHQQGTQEFCLRDATEAQELVPATATSGIPPTYTGCQVYGDESSCMPRDGPNVQVSGLHGANSEKRGLEKEDNADIGIHFSECEELSCVSDTGIELRDVDDGAKSTSDCSRQDRTYNVGLRIGLLFVILVTSFTGVIGPVLLKPVLPAKFQVFFIILKQFGTGVIIATAFVHLLTHAQQMFTNKCVGELDYEATGTAITMAGLFLSFVVEYASHRLAQKFSARSQYNDEVVGVVVLEAGIVFHSLLIGLTLVVTDDSFFITLFVVILFHQMFEGLALGTRIASVGHRARVEESNASPDTSTRDKSPPPEIRGVTGHGDSHRAVQNGRSLSMLKKFLMAGAFALITPIGMVIGIGILHQFNDQSRSTLIALGTLNAVSAGILIWVGVVEMWAGDWMFGGELADAGPLLTTLAGIGLAAGMALMSFLGKWT